MFIFVSFAWLRYVLVGSATRLWCRQSDTRLVRLARSRTVIAGQMFGRFRLLRICCGCFGSCLFFIGLSLLCRGPESSGGRINTLSPELKRPCDEASSLFGVGRIGDFDRPSANRVLFPVLFSSARYWKLRNPPVLERHELPPWEPRIRFVKSPLPRQDTHNPVWTGELHLDIPAALMLDPDSHSHMLQSLEIRILQHLRSHLESARNSIGCQERALRFGDRYGFWLRLACGRDLAVVAAALRLRLGIILSLLPTWIRGRRVGEGKIDGRRVEPSLRFDKWPRLCSFDEAASICSSIPIYQVSSLLLESLES